MHVCIHKYVYIYIYVYLGDRIANNFSLFLNISLRGFVGEIILRRRNSECSRKMAKSRLKGRLALLAGNEPNVPFMFLQLRSKGAASPHFALPCIQVSLYCFFRPVIQLHEAFWDQDCAGVHVWGACREWGVMGRFAILSEKTYLGLQDAGNVCKHVLFLCL